MNSMRLLGRQERGAREAERESGRSWASKEGGIGGGLEEVFAFDSKRENRDRAVETIESVSEARAC